MLLGYKMKCNNHVVDVSSLAPFKDKTCEVIIFSPRDDVIFPFKRWIYANKEIEEYNRISSESEKNDGVEDGSYGRMSSRYLIRTPIEDGPVWIIINSDDLLRER